VASDADHISRHCSKQRPGLFQVCCVDTLGETSCRSQPAIVGIRRGCPGTATTDSSSSSPADPTTFLAGGGPHRGPDGNTPPGNAICSPSLSGSLSPVLNSNSPLRRFSSASQKCYPVLSSAACYPCGLYDQPRQHHMACCLVAFCVLERERHDRRLSIYKLKRQLRSNGPSCVIPAMERLKRAA
jgi:hypothetical protein